MVLSIIFLVDKRKMLLRLSIFYEYQQFFQHRICFSIQPPDYSDPWPRLARSSSFFLIMLFNDSKWTWIEWLESFSETRAKRGYPLKGFWSLLNGIGNMIFLFNYTTCEVKHFVYVHATKWQGHNSVAHVSHSVIPK